jgi:long-chain acyl-CoA synthetase
VGEHVNYHNLIELHRRQAESLGPKPALCYRRQGVYHDLSWESYRADALACAAALADSGIQPGDRVALVSENRLEWLVADMGILGAGAVNVPPHAPLSARQVQFQLADAEARWVFVSNREQLHKILAVRQDLPLLQGIVTFDPVSATEAEANGRVQTWRGFLQHGRQALPRLAEALQHREQGLTAEHLATIIYTSGTTGNPKGVMLTHGNLLSNTLAAIEVAPFEPGDIILNWLPFSHIYARTVDHYESLAAGVLLCLAESADTLVRDLEEIRPTHMASVPRFYEKLLAAVAAAEPSDTGKRLRAIFGPQIRWLSAGGAPLPKPVGEIYAAAGLPVYQGYGLTESSPVITFNRAGHNKVGTVGQALPGVEVAIAPDGEVLCRGPNVMKGYWKNSQATAEALDGRWLRTGDLGSLDSDGFLTITGRKKELLVLSNGKKVVPPYLEGLLLGDDCVDQAVIYGEGRNFLTALIVPYWANVRRCLQGEGANLDDQPPERLARNPAVVSLLRKRIDAALADVSSWEQVRKFIVLPNPFTVAADELTVSLKLRRNIILARHAKELEALYRE